MTISYKVTQDYYHTDQTTKVVGRDFYKLTLVRLDPNRDKKHGISRQISLFLSLLHFQVDVSYVVVTKVGKECVCVCERENERGERERERERERQRERERERARQVRVVDGVARINGNISTSRSLGDVSLKVPRPPPLHTHLEGRDHQGT